MPIGAYFKGHGDEIMSNMQKEYGDTKGTSVFYALANKRHAKPMWQGGIAAPEQLDENGDPIQQGPPPMPALARPPMRRFSPDEAPPQPPEQGPPPPPMAQQGPPQLMASTPTPMPSPPPSIVPPRPQMQVQEDQADPSQVGPMPPPSPPKPYSVQAEQDAGPPQPPQSRIGQDPMQQRYREAQGKIWQKAQEKVPVWKQAIGAALSVSPRLRGVGQAIMHPPDKLEEAMPTLQQGAQYAEKEQQAQSNEAEKESQIKANESWHAANVAARLAAIKPAPTPVDRYRQAKDIPGITDEQVMEFALNGKVKPLSEKPDQYGAAAPGSTVFNRNTGEQGFTAPEKDPRNTKTEDLEQGITAKVKIADEQGLKGAERQHFIYGTPIPNQNIINIPGLGQGTASSTSTATGDEFLKTLPGGTAAQVRAISEGRAALPPLSSRGSGALLRDAVFKYDPEFNEQRAQMRRAFTSGKQGDNIRALNTATVHLGQLHEAAEAMKNGSFQPGNQIYNYVAQKFGKRATTDYAFVMTSLAGEAATALKGNATDPEIAHVLASLSPNMSPEQALGVTEAGLHVFGAKLNTAEESYRQTNPGDRVWTPVLPTAKAVYEKYGVQALQGGSQQQPAAGGRKEQHSPSTGQYRFTLDGGKTWQPGRLPRQ